MRVRAAQNQEKNCWRPGLVPDDTAKPGFQAHKSYLGNLSYCQTLGQSPKSLGILGTIHLDTVRERHETATMELKSGARS